MPQVEYTDSSNNKHTLDLTNPTDKELDEFYEKHIAKYYKQYYSELEKDPTSS
jgi:hypothetical protein|tara:strand:+ start:358 stop:516 length:159 start_codon:yes stop_codon:yes gene_type:complete